MKKFMLVPSTNANVLHSPLIKKLSALDAEMKEILEKQDIGEYTKSSLYQEALNKYLKVKEQLLEPHPIPIVERSETIPNAQKIDIDIFPKNYRTRANQLLNHIRESTDLNWNEKGELLVSGRPVTGSHVVDLVGDLVKPKMKHTSTPRGMDDMVEALIMSNAPMSLIGNKSRFNAITPPVTAHHTGSIGLTKTPVYVSPKTPVIERRWLRYP